MLQRTISQVCKVKESRPFAIGLFAPRTWQSAGFNIPPLRSLMVKFGYRGPTTVEELILPTEGRWAVQESAHEIELVHALCVVIR